jgi:AraC-like DNA-binding protein
VARLRRARALLSEGMALSEAAAACGFADQSHLNRVFKRLMGVPPGRYRAQLSAAARD